MENPLVYETSKKKSEGQILPGLILETKSMFAQTYYSFILKMNE